MQGQTAAVHQIAPRIPSQRNESYCHLGASYYEDRTRRHTKTVKRLSFYSDNWINVLSSSPQNAALSWVDVTSCLCSIHPLQQEEFISAVCWGFSHMFIVVLASAAIFSPFSCKQMVTVIQVACLFIMSL